MRKSYLSSGLAVLLIAQLICWNCKSELKEKGEPGYIEEVKAWHGKRIENLKKENGWLNLVGLMWLKEGENKIGSDKSNDIVFPVNAPAFMGKIILKDSITLISTAKDVEITNEGKKITELELVNDLKGKPTVLACGTLRWNIIKRGEKYGIRLRDLEAPLLKSFKGIVTYPINSDWKIEASFGAYKPQKKIVIPNVLGMIDTVLSSGAIVFKHDKNEYQLDIQDAGDSYFVIFADETSGKETYGAGRFLSVSKPKEGEKFYIDFNKSYNPPCSFTKYATCPLPPKQNHLKLEVTAGEKNFGEGH